MDYLKLFENHNEYETFIDGGGVAKPNVSHCVSENEVHYNAIPIMTVKYNVTDASNPTQLYFYMSREGRTVNGALMFDKVVIDGNEVSIADLDAANGQTQLSVGEHTVKYTLKDPTFIGAEFDEQAGMLTKIGALFVECPSVISVNIPNSVTSIGNDAFNGCISLTSVTIPNSVTSIGDGAFDRCSSLTSVTIPNSVTSIGDRAFNGCISLTSVTIPNSVTSIGYGAFQECTSLTNVIIGSGITYIESSAFESNFGLMSVIIQALTPPTLESNVFDGNASGRKIYVPSASVNAYKAANGWSTYANDIEPIQ